MQGRYRGRPAPPAVGRVWISETLSPPLKMFLTGMRHLQRIFRTKLLDPSKNHIPDRIVNFCPQHQGMGGVDQRHGLRNLALSRAISSVSAGPYWASRVWRMGSIALFVQKSCVPRMYDGDYRGSKRGVRLCCLTPRFYLVPEVGIEPTRAQGSPDFESGASTYFTTPAKTSLIP